MISGVFMRTVCTAALNLYDTVLTYSLLMSVSILFVFGILQLKGAYLLISWSDFEAHVICSSDLLFSNVD